MGRPVGGSMGRGSDADAYPSARNIADSDPDTSAGSVSDADPDASRRNPDSLGRNADSEADKGTYAYREA